MGPVVVKHADVMHVQGRLAVIAFQSVVEGTEAWLTSSTGHCRHSNVDDIDTGLSSGDIGCHPVPRRIVGMQVNRNIKLGLQAADQLIGRLGFEQARHVLNANDLCTSVDQALGHLHVVIKGVFMLIGTQKVTSKAHCPFGNLTGFPNIFNAALHLFKPVKRVKDSEDIDPGLSTMVDKAFQNVVGIVPVANRVGRPQQHLLEGVGHILLQQPQPGPRVFSQEPVADVEGRSTPALN